MTQTAEGYIIDGAVVPDKKPENFTDETAWPTHALVESLMNDYMLMSRGAPPEQAQRLGRSIMHKGFELTQRGVSLPEL